MLLHIGYHKTATTWLQRYVFSEPLLGFVQPWDSSAAMQSIALAPPFCFNREAVRRSLSAHELPLADRRGRVPVLSHERFSGIPYTGGHDSETILERLHGVFPEARVLITVREQCEIVWSTYRQYVLDGGTESPGQWLSAPKTGFGMATRFDLDFYCYDRLVQGYVDRFGADQVLVLPYEILAADPLEYVDRVTAFTGAIVDPPGRESLRALPATNLSMGRYGTAAKRVANLAVIRTWLSPASPVDVEGFNYIVGRVLYRLEGLLTARRTASSVPDVVRRALRERYVSSNRTLGRLIGMNLGDHGYQW